MPAFQYVALNPKGKTEKGLLEGDSARQVRQFLREKALIPVEVAQVSAVREKGGKTSANRHLKPTDLALITRQLATLIDAALPLEQALGTVAKQIDKTRLSALLLALRTRVLEGHSLAAALNDFPRAFPPLYRATVAAGEQSGYLNVVFERLADYTERQQTTRQKIGLTLFYPLLLTAVAILVVTGLLVYVVPQVVQVFDSTGQTLPLLTRALIAVSHFLQTNLWPLSGISALILLLFLYGLRHTQFRFIVHTLLLKMPIIGRLLRGSNTARFARTLSILISSSVPLLSALQIATKVIDLLPMRAAVAGAAIEVKEGGSLSAALHNCGYFPPLAVQLIASGEASGRLEAMLERAAHQQEQETETLATALLGLFEPVLILVMGALVLIIVLAILLPIFDLNQLVQ